MRRCQEREPVPKQVNYTLQAEDAEEEEEEEG